MIRAGVLFALVTSAFAVYTGYGLGNDYGAGYDYVLGYAGYSGYTPAIANVAHAVPAVATYHARPVATDVAAPVATYAAAPAVTTTVHHAPVVATVAHAAPAYVVSHYAFGHGLLGYGLNYGYGLGSPYEYGVLLRKKK